MRAPDEINNLGTSELLCQLAEECSELAKAALKLRRALDGTNPTPKSKEECEKDILEEVADVDQLLGYLGYLDEPTYEKVRGIQRFKEERWVGRLKQ